MLRISQRISLPIQPLFTHQFAITQVRGKKKKASAKQNVDVSKETAGLMDLSKYNESMSDTLETLKNDYARLRSGLPAPSLLDDIPVVAYGSRAPLKSVAQVSVRDARTMFITTFDDRTVSAVEKAVRSSGLNLNPVVEADGRLRIPVPKPSKESRKAMKETVLKGAEAAKVATRMVRRKAMEEIKGLKEDLSKDDVRRLENNVQTMTDQWIDRITIAQNEKVDAVSDPSLAIRK